MLPLGAALIALDLPFTRKRIEKWMETLQQKWRPEFVHSIGDDLTGTNSAYAVIAHRQIWMLKSSSALTMPKRCMTGKAG